MEEAQCCNHQVDYGADIYPNILMARHLLGDARPQPPEMQVFLRCLAGHYGVDYATLLVFPHTWKPERPLTDLLYIDPAEDDFFFLPMLAHLVGFTNAPLFLMCRPKPTDDRRRPQSIYPTPDAFLAANELVVVTLPAFEHRYSEAQRREWRQVEHLQFGVPHHTLRVPQHQLDPVVVALPAARCAKCLGNLTKLLCEGCFVQQYCSTACQRSHWPNHRRICVPASKDVKRCPDHPVRLPTMADEKCPKPLWFSSKSSFAPYDN